MVIVCVFFVFFCDIEMPQHIILMGLFGTIAYFMYGLQNDVDKFFIYLLVVVSSILKLHILVWFFV